VVTSTSTAGIMGRVTRTGWHVIVPVKRTVQGKSRLADFAGTLRSDLAFAIAIDTISAAIAATRVARLVVVTDDERVRAEAGRLGAYVLADVSGGLNAALRHGADAVATLDPDAPLAALQGDLPALRPADLTGALDLADSHDRAFVSDAEATGTTLLTAASRARFDPAFGIGSSLAHRQRGFVELDARDAVTADGEGGPGGWSSLRRDVDTDASLREAATIGLGVRTLLVFERLMDSPRKPCRPAG
jgi:2-phospho-L-lactate guanylyltransferase